MKEQKNSILKCCSHFLFLIARYSVSAASGYRIHQEKEPASLKKYEK